jgi:predicted ATPase
MATTGEWRMAAEQSRGEGVLSLVTARADAGESLLYLLDEPEIGLSPQRQLTLLCLLDELHRDGRWRALVATHSPILMSHPGAIGCGSIRTASTGNLSSISLTGAT